MKSGTYAVLCQKTGAGACGQGFIQFCPKRRGPAQKGGQERIQFCPKRREAGAGGESGTYTVLCQETEVGLGVGASGTYTVLYKKAGAGAEGGQTA